MEPVALEQAFKELVVRGRETAPETDPPDFGTPSVRRNLRYEELALDLELGAAESSDSDSDKEKFHLAKDFFHTPRRPGVPPRSRTTSFSEHLTRTGSPVLQRLRVPDWSVPLKDFKEERHSPTGPLSPQDSSSFESPGSSFPAASQPSTPFTSNTETSTPPAADAFSDALRTRSKLSAPSPIRSVVRSLSSKIAIECTAPQVLEPVITEPFNVRHEHHVGVESRPLASNVNRWVEEVALDLKKQKAIPLAVPLPPKDFTPPVEDLPKKGGLLSRLGCGSIQGVKCVTAEGVGCSGRSARTPPEMADANNTRGGDRGGKSRIRPQAKSFFASPARQKGTKAMPSKEIFKELDGNIRVPPLKLSLSPVNIPSPAPGPPLPPLSLNTPPITRSELLNSHVKSEMDAALRELRRLAPGPSRPGEGSTPQWEEYPRFATPQPGRHCRSLSRQSFPQPPRYPSSPYRSLTRPSSPAAYLQGRESLVRQSCPDAQVWRISQEAANRLVAMRGRHSELETRQRSQALANSASAKLARMPSVYQAGHTGSFSHSGPLPKHRPSDGYVL